MSLILHFDWLNNCQVTANQKGYICSNMGSVPNLIDGTNSHLLSFWTSQISLCHQQSEYRGQLVLISQHVLRLSKFYFVCANATTLCCVLTDIVQRGHLICYVCFKLCHKTRRLEGSNFNSIFRIFFVWQKNKKSFPEVHYLILENLLFVQETVLKFLSFNAKQNTSKMLFLSF